MLPTLKLLSYLLSGIMFIYMVIENALMIERPNSQNDRNFLMKREIKQNLLSYPFISGEVFRSFSDYIVNDSISAKNLILKDNVQFINTTILFVKVDFLRYLNFFLSDNHAKYILITHDSALSAPSKYSTYLDDPNMIRWFAQNTDRYHPKLESIPLGIANSKYPHGNQTILIQKTQHLKPMTQRSILLYINFSNSTYSKRKSIFEKFCVNSKISTLCESGKNWSTYLDRLGDSQFVLSPFGAGIDCHRTWESIAMGAIPIVENSTINRVYEGERILVVRSFYDVTEELLEETSRKWNKIDTEKSKLKSSYWLNVLQTLKNN